MVETVYNIINLVATWFGIVRPIHRRYYFTRLTEVTSLGQFLPVFRKAIKPERTIYTNIGAQVILTSSLENDAFGMPGVRYANAVIQVSYRLPDFLTMLIAAL